MSEVPAIDEKGISLFRLKTELVELMALRQEEGTLNEAVALDNQIKAYIAAELRKVDNIAAFIRHRRAMAKAAKEEAARLAKLAASYEAEEEYVTGMCKELMLQFKERKLEGVLGSIALQKNGGNVGVEIPQPAMLPEEYVKYVGTITSKAWSRICQTGRSLGVEFENFEGVLLERVPMLEAVRKGLEKGPVAGAQLAERGEHVRIR